MSVFPRTPLPGTVWPPRALRDPGKPRVVIGQLSGLLPCCPPAPCAQPGLSRGGGRPGALSAASRLRAPPVFTAGVTGPPLTARSAPSPTAGSPPQCVPRSAVCVDGAGDRGACDHRWEAGQGLPAATRRRDGRLPSWDSA
uniref:Uncharacterized protein n=1 Tax=Rousettus aegyptiacus TaxID=9407 RepID=A0A7J8FJ95_ROUAE|nr:hypothetical protein HJG63_012035 [Rousettus aegyptiacus]